MRWQANIFAVRAVAAFLVAGAFCTQDRPSIAENLADRFFVPRSAHIEVLASRHLVPIKGVNARSIDDVLTLHAAFSRRELTEQAIRSWEFLHEAGLERAPRPPLPPLPPGATLVAVAPDWLPEIVDIDGSNMRHDSIDANGAPRVIVRTPNADVMVSKSTEKGQVNHQPPGTNRFQKYDLYYLFSRSPGFLERDWQEIPAAEERRFLHEYPTGVTGFLVADRTADAILARGFLKGDRLMAFGLHLRFREQNQPKTFRLPTLTIDFQRNHPRPGAPDAGADWQITCAIIRQAQFDVPIDPSRFSVPLQPGQVYVVDIDGRGETASPLVRTPVPDVARLSPSAGLRTVMPARRAER